MRPALGIAAYLLQILAILSLALAILPVLYPIVTALGLLVIVLSLVVLVLYPRSDRIGAPGSQVKLESALPGASGGASGTVSNAEPRRFSRAWIQQRGTTRRAWRAARLSLFAILSVFLFYGILRLHSDFYYQATLNQELEPLRDAFREAAPPTADPPPQQ